MLTRLFCDNYKCLVNFEFKPTPMQLLMGRNGSGKSTVFEILALLRDFAVRGDPCEDRLLGTTRTRWQDLPVQRFELDVSGNGGIYNYELVVDEWGKPLLPRIRKEKVTFNGNPLYLFENGVVHLHNDQFEDRAQFPIFPKRSYLYEIESRPENAKLMWFKNWLDHVTVVQVDPKAMKRSQAQREAVYPAPDLSNFAEWYRHLRQDNSAGTDALRVSLQEIVDGFEGLDLKGPQNGTKELHVSVRTGMGGKPNGFTFSELSDGQRSLVGLYTLLHCALVEHSTLCIDEPDNFIALSEIQPWLLLLIDRAEETSSQIMIASHHPEFLNQLASRNGVVIERSNAGPTLPPRAFELQNDTTLTAAEIVARGWNNV